MECKQHFYCQFPSYTDSRIAIVSSCALSTGKMPSEGLPMNSVARITDLAPNVFEGGKEKARKRFTFISDERVCQWSGFLDMAICTFHNGCLWWPPFCKSCHMTKINKSCCMKA